MRLTEDKILALGREHAHMDIYDNWGRWDSEQKCCSPRVL